MRLSDVLRAEVHGLDLHEDDSGIVVCAEREDGTLYEVGRISVAAVYQDPAGARKAIGRIKFGAKP